MELLDVVLRRVARLNPHLNAFITVLDRSREQALALQEELARGQARGPLHGIPVSIKDLIFTRGVRTTGGSRVFRHQRAEEDAAVVVRLREAGAVLMGKTNLHECAFGVTSNNPHFGPVRNPWDPERIPGGSSGGSGAAVAAGLGFASLGTDTRGSIRIPAAACGIVGLKPTYGRVSTRGVITLSWSLDHVGPMTRSTEDAALVLQAVAGYDPDDPTSADRPVADYPAAIEKSLKGLRLGICRPYFFEGVDSEIRAAVEKAVQVLQAAGMELREVTIPHLSEALQVSTHLQRAEATAYHQDHLTTRPGEYGEEVRKKLESGWSISAVDYLNAQWSRQVLKQEFSAVFEEVDCLIAPTLPGLPPRLGEEFVSIDGEQEEIGQAYVRLNAPQNLTGFPALALPCGFSRHGLPIGMQLVADAFREEILFTVGAEYERHTDWQRRRPPLPLPVID